ncbi:N-acetylmuramoyl-L-alanine amidase [Streptomyces harbinensis]|uniref:peptidoglycan recognition protein family protein n=1 Tax=Streptomyces harbinensis TaxID=1176198 RepID=UPI00371FE8EC
MANPLSADRILAALKAEGVRVVEYKGWRTHNRNSAGAWGPVHGVMIHHTVTSGTASSVELCYSGRSDLPGPLCHAVIDKAGVVHLVGHGRANHAGRGDSAVLQAVQAERPLPPDTKADTDGNPHFYGFECINLGDNRDPWPTEQVEAAVRASAALLRAHGWGRSGDTSVIGHAEWQPGKIDPLGPGVSMADIRARVAARLRHTPDWTPPEEDDMPQRIVLESNGYQRTIEPNTWTTLNWTRIWEGAWRDKDPEPSVLLGPCAYSISVGLTVAGLAHGQEFKVRVARYREEDGKYVRVSAMPTSSPVNDAGKGHFVYGWTGHVPAAKKGRLRVEVQHHGEDPVTVESARAEALYWPGAS